MAGKSGDQVKARERARAARQAAFADQRAREEAIEEHVASYFLAGDERERLTGLVAEQEQQMAAAVAALVGLKEPVDRIAKMLGTDTSTVKAHKRAASTGAGPAAVPAPGE